MWEFKTSARISRKSAPESGKVITHGRPSHLEKITGTHFY
jgi:hypothetical protein